MASIKIACTVFVLFSLGLVACQDDGVAVVEGPKQVSLGDLFGALGGLMKAVAPEEDHEELQGQLDEMTGLLDGIGISAPISSQETESQDQTDEMSETFEHLSSAQETVCRSNQFKCQSGTQCIHGDYRCDGDNDCVDGSDEEDCNNYVCPSNRWKCQSGTQCINREFRCDGYKRCVDESDEDDCKDYGDCIDGSDEDDCEDYVCSSAYWKCQSGTQCIVGDYRCDGYKLSDRNNPDWRIDCKDGSDEDDCENYVCPSYKWKCQSGTQCILGFLRCDGESDCKDGSDEVDCPNKVCQSWQWKCQSGNQCIRENPDRCDGHTDCKDGSDEVDCTIEFYNISTSRWKPAAPKK